MFWFCSSRLGNCHRLLTSSKAPFGPPGPPRRSSQPAPGSLAPSFLARPARWTSDRPLPSPHPRPRLSCQLCFSTAHSAGHPLFSLSPDPFPSAPFAAVPTSFSFPDKRLFCTLSRHRTCALHVSPPPSKLRQSGNGLARVGPGTALSRRGTRAPDARTSPCRTRARTRGRAAPPRTRPAVWAAGPTGAPSSARTRSARGPGGAERRAPSRAAEDADREGRRPWSLSSMCLAAPDREGARPR